MKIPKDILSNNEKVPYFEKISTQILKNNQNDRVIIIKALRVSIDKLKTSSNIVTK